MSCSIDASVHSKKVSGTVAYVDGKTIAGAPVIVEGTHVGTSTKVDGQYTLDVRKEVRDAMTCQGGSGSTIYQDIQQDPVDIDYGNLKDYDNSYYTYTPCTQAP